MRQIPFGKPTLGEEELLAVKAVLDSGTLVHGPVAKEFEQKFREFTGSEFAISCASATAALHLGYFFLEIGKGDEVIVPAMTHTATAHAVEYCGAKPVFVDVERETGNIDIDQIEAAITDRTKAISVVHYLGMPVDMRRVSAIAKKHELFLVEDCALAIGSYLGGKHAGNFGDTGCYSFYPVKHITTAEGGILTTNRADIAERITRQKAFGYDRSIAERTMPGLYDVTILGFNYRMNEIEAAIGAQQMKRLPEILRRRRENFEALENGIQGIPEVTTFRSSHDEFQSSYYCFSLLLNDRLAKKRFDLVAYLKERGIGTSIYYPRPVPHFSYYQQKYGYAPTTFPNAKWVSENSIALPCGPHLSREDVEYIIGTLKEGIPSIR